MKEALQRAMAQKAAAKVTPAKPAAQVAAPAAPAAPASREWAKPDKGHEYRPVAPAPAPKPTQSGLNAKIVALLAQQAKPTYR